jgi:tripartite ATP-independent transporter DctP family solute receptor
MLPKIMKMYSKKITMGCVAALALSMTSTVAFGEVIKFHHDLPDTSAQHKGAVKFKELVEAATNGTYQVEIYANNALGDDIEVAQQMQFGAVQAAPIPTAKLSNFSPSLQLIDLPFLFPSVEATYDLLDSAEVGGVILKSLEDAGFVGAKFWESGSKQLTCNHLVSTPKDYVGRKVRVMESPLLIAQFEALGATAIPVAFSETYTALQQGVVECQENPIVSIHSMKFYEVQDYMMLSNHGYIATAFIFSKVWFDAQASETQDILMAAAQEAGDYQRQVSAEDNQRLLQEIRDAGTTEVIELTPEQLALFAEAMQPVHERFSDRIGKDLLETAYTKLSTFAN